MKVYVVVRGEHGEGGNILAVYDKPELAEAHAATVRTSPWFYPECDSCEVEEWLVLEE